MDAGNDQSGKRFSWKARGKSFRHAFQGLWMLFRDEHNARIHVGAGLLAIVLGLWLEIGHWDWLALSLSIGMVLMAEALNAALERLADALHPAHHPLIGQAKDLGAAGVLLAALAALVTGLLIFLPPLWRWLEATVR